MDDVIEDTVAPPSGAPSATACAAWSLHAAELAVPVARELQVWEESPTTARMVADGYLWRLLPGVYAPPDLLDSAVGRALALGCAVGEQLRPHHVIAGPSAAWVLLGGAPPEPAELLSATHRSPVAGVVMRHAQITAEQIETLGGAPITVPARTAVDLLRFAREEVAAALVAALLESGHVQAREIRATLSGMAHQHRARSARQRLQRILRPLRLEHPCPRGEGEHEEERPRTVESPVRVGPLQGRRIIRRAPVGQEAESGAAAETGFPSAVTR